MHADFIQQILRDLLDTTAAFHIANTSTTALRLGRNGETTLTWFNRCDHLGNGLSAL